METIIKFSMENLYFVFFLTAYVSIVILAVADRIDGRYGSELLLLRCLLLVTGIILVPLAVSIAYCFVCGIEVIIFPWAWLAAGVLAFILFIIYLLLIHWEGCGWGRRKTTLIIASVLYLINLLFPFFVLYSLIGETVIGRIFIVVYAIAAIVDCCLFVNAVMKRWK